MLFYAATGSYQIRNEDGHKLPYIMRLGKLHPVSVPEFVVWSSLLWEVLSYDEAKKAYYDIMANEHAVPSFDDLAARLVRRKLIVKGEGYTGIDALYNMLAGTFVIPMRETEGFRRLLTACKLYLKGVISLRDVFFSRSTLCLSDDMCQVLRLVQQTPLSAAELVTCFDRGIKDVSNTEKLIAGIYPREDSRQDTLPNEAANSANRDRVLDAIANLYLGHRVILELP